MPLCCWKDKVAPDAGAEQPDGEDKDKDKNQGGGEDEKSGAFVQGSDRSCHDLPCCILFVVFWIGMLVVLWTAVGAGEPERLLYGTDYEGLTCGVDNSGKVPVNHRIVPVVVADSFPLDTLPDAGGIQGQPCGSGLYREEISFFPDYGTKCRRISTTRYGAFWNLCQGVSDADISVSKVWLSQVRRCQRQRQDGCRYVSNLRVRLWRLYCTQCVENCDAHNATGSGWDATRLCLQK